MPTEVAYRYEVVDGYPWSLADMCAPRPIFLLFAACMCIRSVYSVFRKFCLLKCVFVF